MSTVHFDSPPVDDTLGVLFVGLLVATGLYGVLCTQTFIYTQVFDDGWLLKSLVALVWTFDTLHLVLIGNGVYYYLITNHMNPDALLTSTWTINVHPVVSCFISFLAQCFFAHRIYRLSEQSMLVASIVILLSFTQLGLGIAMSVRAFELVSFSNLPSAEWLIGSALGLNFMCDSIITIIICFYLHTSKRAAGFKSTKTTLNTLIIWSMTTGALTSFVAIINLATFLAFPTNLINIGVNIMLAKIYSNSLLATLNARRVAQRLMSRDYIVNLSNLPSGDLISGDVVFRQEEGPEISQKAGSLRFSGSSRNMEIREAQSTRSAVEI
ncbi:hypothetical protein HYDPIDRAFT_42319 [Hydnomerulius pinastri MD-312]|uniref:DUF6534 domain-containing protein n=1 Tax=Hydnomerulius pinastri MD-312 TaxID=994086 RepID=A0A0C9VUS6_9AGAM|nr:hypothetical protein HYDPIDRAFT_42319 [Hydnomerulius pinastri MD-312]